jgi:hypothetical protein
MTETLVRYVRHLMRSSSLYPVWTFWLACVIVVPATGAEWITHGEALVFLGIVALILVVIADRRDAHHEAAEVAADLKKETQAVSAELSGKVAEVHDLVNHASDVQEARILQLIEVIQTHGIDVPPPDELEET